MCLRLDAFTSQCCRLGKSFVCGPRQGFSFSCTQNTNKRSNRQGASTGANTFLKSQGPSASTQVNLGSGMMVLKMEIPPVFAEYYSVLWSTEYARSKVFNPLSQGGSAHSRLCKVSSDVQKKSLLSKVSLPKWQVGSYFVAFSALINICIRVLHCLFRKSVLAIFLFHIKPNSSYIHFSS